MVKLTSHESEVLEMLAGTRPFEWGARVSACIESLHGNGYMYVTKAGGVPLLTDKGRAALADGGRDAG